MEIIIAILVVGGGIYLMKQYKDKNSSKHPEKKSAYKKSWENGGKGSKKWSTKK